jgi:hypothetical protein
VSIEDPGSEPCGCDHEMIFDLAEGGLEGEAAREVRSHLQHCPGCHELYEHEVRLNAYLGSLDFPASRSCSVHRAVAMALPTRSAVSRLLWAALAATLLVLAVVYLELNGTELVMMVMSLLATCWGFVSGSADVVRAVLAAAGPTGLLVLGFGALVDLVIATAAYYVAVSRGRRAREA